MKTDAPSMLVNVALGKPAAQSSRSKQSKQDDPAGAVNGSIGNSYGFYTDFQENPWWRVDLGHSYPIEKIVIHNRRDQQMDRAKRVQVDISQDLVAWQLVHAGCVHFGAGEEALVLPLRCKETARYVRVSVRGKSHLHLAQIEVYGDSSKPFRNKYRLDTLPLAGTRKTAGRIPYVLEDETGKPLAAAPDDTLTGFKLRPIGRLGNQMLQLINAIALAKRSGIKFIRTLDGGLFKLQEPAEYDGVTLLPQQADAPVPGAFLSGNFFFRDDLLPALDKVPQAERHRIVQEFIRPKVMSDLPLDGDIKDDDELTIHIRAGDIFKEAPMGYTQPPLAFYRMIVRYGIEHALFSKVRVVFENTANPCVDGLLAWLKQEGIPSRTQSGALTEDIAALVNARFLSFGFGTFGIAIALLSQRPSTIFCFEGFTNTSYPGLPSVARTIVVRDAAKGYMKVGEWKNTPSQREQMMTYPEENLEILAPRLDEDPAAPADKEQLDVQPAS